MIFRIAQVLHTILRIYVQITPWSLYLQRFSSPCGLVHSNIAIQLSSFGRIYLPKIVRLYSLLQSAIKLSQVLPHSDIFVFISFSAKCSANAVGDKRYECVFDFPLL